MSGKKGGGSLAQKNTKLHSLNVQTSAQGQVMPFAFGTVRLAGKLIDYVDFAEHVVPSSGGKKTGGGGKKGGGNEQCTYSATPLILLCRGSRTGIKGIHNVYDTRGKLAVLQSTTVTTIPAGGGTVTVAPPSSGVFFSDLGVVYDAPYSVVANDFGSDGAQTLSGTQQVPLAPGGTGAGQYSANLSTGQYIVGASPTGATITVYITYTYSVPNSQGDGSPPVTLTFTAFLGTMAQSAWSYMVSAHAARARAYRGIVYLGIPNADLGASGALPNFNFEVSGLLLFGGGSMDAEPSAIASHLLNDDINGIGFSWIDSAWLANWRANNVANGLLISPIYDSQQALAKIIDELAEITNTAVVFTDSLKFRPYGDRTVIGNGATYTPDTAPIYDLTDDDYAETKGEPVQVSRGDVSLVSNIHKVQFNNRSKDYNSDVAEAKDQYHIKQYGPRPKSPYNFPAITTAVVAKKVAEFKKQREIQIRAQYKFPLTMQFALLEPMDLVRLKDPGLFGGLVPVRLTRITEDAKGTFACQAEEFPWGTATATLYPHQDTDGYQIDGLADPGDVNPPTIFELNDQLSLLLGNGGYALGIALSGLNSNWGGCTVWLSSDGITWNPLVKKQFGKSIMGVLTTGLPASGDPDTTDSVGVDLTESAGELESFPAADCDGFRSICYLEDDPTNSVGEIIAYEDATLTAVNKYTLGTRLRRSVHGSAVATHVAAEKFVFLDDLVYILQLDSSWVGKTVHLKFTSFNNSHLMEQAIAGVAEYTFAFQGLFNNYFNVVGNDGHVDSVGTGGPPFTAATIRVYGEITGTPTVGEPVHMLRADRTTFSVNVSDFTGKSLGTTYFVLYNPNSRAAYLVTTYSDYLAALTQGHVGIGWTTTPDSGGSGGSSGGSGGGGFGGGGGGGRPPLLA